MIGCVDPMVKIKQRFHYFGNFLSFNATSEDNFQAWEGERERGVDLKTALRVKESGVVAGWIIPIVKK